MEVVIALGVTSFGLVAILGLFGAGASADKTASQSTTLATMTLQALEQTRANTNVTVAQLSSYSTNFYFDNQGNPLLPTAANIYYRCVLATSDTGSSPPANNSNPPYNAPPFISATMTFTWPYRNGAASAPFTNTFYGSMPP